MNGLTLFDHVSIIKDPRKIWKVEHCLADILFLCEAAVIELELTRTVTQKYLTFKLLVNFRLFFICFLGISFYGDFLRFYLKVVVFGKMQDR
jgi:hypothetical protein